MKQDDVNRARNLIEQHVSRGPQSPTRAELAWAYRVFADWFEQSEASAYDH